MIRTLDMDSLPPLFLDSALLSYRRSLAIVGIEMRMSLVEPSIAIAGRLGKAMCYGSLLGRVLERLWIFTWSILAGSVDARALSPDWFHVAMHNQCRQVRRPGIGNRKRVK